MLNSQATHLSQYILWLSMKGRKISLFHAHASQLLNDVISKTFFMEKLLLENYINSFVKFKIINTQIIKR